MGNGVGTMRFQPGSPCCEGPCLVARDPLDDANPNGFSLMAGDWGDVSSADGYTTSTGIVELWHVTPHPDDPYPSDVRVRVRGAAGSILRIVLSASGDVATGDALIVELAPGADCGTLKLYQRQGGVEDVLATIAVYGAVVDEWHDLRACYDPETTVLTGSILPHDETSWRQTSVEVEAHTDGEYAGFASGTADQSDFDTFVFRKLWYDRIITPLCPVMSVAQTQEGHAAAEGSQPSWVGYLTWSESPSDSFSFSITIDGQTYSQVFGYSPYIGLGFSVWVWMQSLGPDVPFWLTVAGGPTSYTISCGTTSEAGYTLPADAVQLSSYPFMSPIDYQPGTAPIASQNEQQNITLVRDGDEGCRVFSLSWGGQTTDPISTAADAATVQAALETLCGAGNVSVTGSAGAWVVEFVGELAETDVAMLAADTTVCGNCLDYSYYYEPETERVTCSTCEQCHIGASHFPDVDSECEWNVLSGTWGTEVPGQGFTISAPLKALYANPIFDDYVDAFMIVLLYSQDYNPLLGEPWVYGLLFGCDATADNGWMARIYSAGGPGGPWYLSLVKIAGGVKTVIGTDAVTGWLGNIDICIFEGYVSVSCGWAFYKVAGAAAGPYWGFEAETMGGSAGDWIISSVTASRVVRTDDLWCPGCPAPCNTCIDNFPGAFVVTIEGLNVLDLTLEWWFPGPLFTFYNGFTNYQISDGSYYVNSISNCLATETYENIAMSTEDDCFVFKLSNTGGPPYAWTCTLRPDLDAKYCAPTCTDTNYHLILTVCLSPNAIRWAGYIDAAPSGYFYVYVELCYWFDADCGGGPTRMPSKIWFLFRMLHDETEDCETMSGTMEFKAARFELSAGDKTYAGNLCSIVPAQNGTILEAVQDYVAGLGANMTVQVAAV